MRGPHVGDCSSRLGSFRPSRPSISPIGTRPAFAWTVAATAQAFPAFKAFPALSALSALSFRRMLAAAAAIVLVIRSDGGRHGGSWLHRNISDEQRPKKHLHFHRPPEPGLSNPLAG
jgi:hypothetical protein